MKEAKAYPLKESIDSFLSENITILQTSFPYTSILNGFVICDSIGCVVFKRKKKKRTEQFVVFVF